MREKCTIVLCIATIILLATFNSAVGTPNKTSNIKIKTPLYSIRISNALERKEIPSSTNYIKKYEKNNIALPKLEDSVLTRFANLIKNNQNFREMFRNIIERGKLSPQVMSELIKKLSEESTPTDILINLNSKIAGKVSPNWTPLTFLICWYIYIWVALFVTAMWSCFVFC